MSDTRTWAEALYDKMSEYSMSAQGDHREHCIVEVLIPWIEADGKRIAELEDNRTNHDVRCNQYHREAEEREQYLCDCIKALEEQAAIDKDFIRQYQEQVVALQDALENISNGDVDIEGDSETSPEVLLMKFARQALGKGDQE